MWGTDPPTLKTGSYERDVEEDPRPKVKRQQVGTNFDDDDDHEYHPRKPARPKVPIPPLFVVNLAIAMMTLAASVSPIFVNSSRIIAPCIWGLYLPITAFSFTVACYGLVNHKEGKIVNAWALAMSVLAALLIVGIALALSMEHDQNLNQQFNQNRMFR
jgi:hypothetical protein